MSNEVGEIIKGKITSITKFGAFVSLPDGKSGMIHISEVSDDFVKDINDFLKIGQDVKVKLCAIDDRGRLSLSLKQAKAESERAEAEKRAKAAEQPKKRIVPEPIVERQNTGDSFEDMMSRFMKTSNEKMSDLKKTTDSKISRPGFSRKNSKKY